MTDGNAPERRGWVLPGLLSMFLVVLLALSLALLRDRGVAAEGPLRSYDIGPGGVRAPGQQQGAAEQAVTVAGEATTRLFSVDHRHVDADIDRLLELTTDDFRADYARDSEGLRRRVEGRRLVISARVPADGIATEHLTTALAQVLVAVDVRTTGSGGLDTDRSYLTRVELERVDDTWRVSGIEEIR